MALKHQWFKINLEAGNKSTGNRDHIGDQLPATSEVDLEYDFDDTSD